MNIKTDALVIGAGPVGLFSVFELGIMGLNAHVVDNLDKIGGQCIELYPDKPIYDIPALPKCTGESLINNLLEQIKPFKTEFHLGERVQSINKNNNNWIVETNLGKKFETPNIIPRPQCQSEFPGDTDGGGGAPTTLPSGQTPDP